MTYFVTSNNSSSYSIVSLDVRSCAVAVSTTQCETTQDEPTFISPFITSTPPYVIIFGCFQYQSSNYTLYILDEQLELLYDIPITSDSYPTFSTYAHSLISVTRKYNTNQTNITSFDLANNGAVNWSKVAFNGNPEGFALDGEGKMYIVEADVATSLEMALYLFSSDGTQLDNTPWGTNRSFSTLSLGTGEILLESLLCLASIT